LIFLNDVGASHELFLTLLRQPVGLRIAHGTDSFWPPKPPVTGFEGKVRVLDHLPFFSACKGFDNELVTYKLFESSEKCSLFDSTNGSFVSEWSGFLADPDKLKGSTDKCKWDKITCMYEEPVDKNAGQSTYWFKLKDGDTVFYLTKDPYTSEEYLDLYDPTPGSAEKPNPKVAEAQSFFNFDQWFIEDIIVPVKIKGPDEDYGELLVAGIPREMELEIGFFQTSLTQKKIVEATLKFKTYDIMTGQANDPLYSGAIDPRYNLTITYQAKVWFELLEIFEFDPLLYLVLSSLVGILLLFICFLMWATVRVTTQLNDPPIFSIAKSFRLITWNVATGFLLGIAPVLLVGGVLLYSYKLFLGNLLTETMAINTGFDLLKEPLQDENKESTLGGRLCISLVFCGLYVVWHALDGLLVEKDIVNVDENQESESLPQPVDLREFDSDVEHSRKQLRKTHIMAVYLVVVWYHAMFWEFSYSFTYSEYVFAITAAMIPWNVWMEHHISNWLQDEVFLNIAIFSNIIIEGITGLGCAGFMDYIINLCLGFAIMAFQRTYLDIWIDMAIDRWDWLLLVIQKVYRVLSPAYDENGAIIVEEFDLESEEFQIEEAPVIEAICGNFGGYTCDAIYLFAAPVLILILQEFEDFTKITKNYDIQKRDLKNYLFFSLSALVSGILIDLHLLSMLELIYGWKIQEYLVYSMHRFSKRLCRWRMYDACNDQSIEPGVQNLDVFGFSSQYYFIVSLSGLGIFLIDLGIQGMIRNKYNPFGDQGAILMLLYSLFICFAVRTLCLKVGTLFIWHLPTGASVGDDGFMHDITNDFFLPSFQEGGEQSYNAGNSAKMLSLYSGEDKNSEAFKIAFLEDNKPWILQRLGVGREISSVVANLDRSLAETSQSKMFDYRDFTNSGVVVSSDDGSSDESDDIKNVKVVLDQVSKNVLRLWLASTRRRMGLPEKAPRADLSSDEESDSDIQPAFGSSSAPKPRFSTQSKAIAKLWLAQLPQHTSSIKYSLDLSDDSSESDRPTKSSVGLQMSASTREIGRLWLASMSRDPASNSRQRPISAASISDSSTDTQTSEYGLREETLRNSQTRPSDAGARMQPRTAFVSETSSSEHVVPMRQQPQRGPQRRPNIAQNLSSSSEEQEESSSDGNAAQVPGTISRATLSIATIWLSKLKR
jgi:hypothetical protein